MFEFIKKYITEFFEEIYKKLKLSLNKITIKDIISSLKNRLLIKSVKHADMFLCKLFLKIGADINCKDSNGKTLLQIVIDDIKIKENDTDKSLLERKFKIIDFLVDNGININGESNNLTALQDACNCNNIELVKKLIDINAKINLTNSTGNNALLNGVKKDFEQIVKVLLERKANPNISDSDGKTPLHIATQKRNIIMTRMLLNANCNTVNSQDSKGNTPLIYACYNECSEIVEELLNYGADPNIYNYIGETPLQIVFNVSNYRIIHLLTQGGANINKQYGNNRETVLHIACKNGQTDFVFYFINNGANVNIQCNNGSTPLYYACFYNRLEIAEILLENGADPYIRTIEEFTPLSICLEKRYYDICKLLLKYKTSLITEKYDNNWRIIHYAVRNNWLGLVQFLANMKEIDLEEKTQDNMTPVKIAKINNHKEIQMFLERKIIFNKLKKKHLTYNNRNRICNNRICNDLIRIARENNFILDIVLKNIYNKSIDEKIKKIEMECSEIIDRERKIEQLKNERRALFELV